MASEHREPLTSALTVENTLLGQGEVTNTKGRRAKVKEFCLGRREKKGTGPEATQTRRTRGSLLNFSTTSLCSNYERERF